ncbi:hypothetical protein LP416_01755 [Polaromonas sp. P2-4]|nr:hypothetical protein LP416_01755 [Polaromonas sp. P2-4]
MRLIVIKQASDLQTLSARLLKKPAAGNGEAKQVSQATLEQVKLLNPHVDFQRMEAGTVLLLPDSPELNDKDSQSLTGNAFDDFITHTSEGFKALAQRVRTSADTLAAERSAVNAVLKTAAVKRQIESDPLLQKQLDAASEEFTAAQKKAQEAAKQVDAMQKAVAEELGALGRLLR